MKSLAIFLFATAAVVLLIIARFNSIEALNQTNWAETVPRIAGKIVALIIAAAISGLTALSIWKKL